ncbi:MAG: transcriptional repressor LexA [Peptoniphilus grossensis]|uniref:transcriptional repressor LexA n=1 Tax=Peptoniphilus grossensis TaxID=1465756 RepID=UPI0025861E73|nr:transcriptional repressor LexA [Peptoniphilus grossensis]MDU5099219.1 transcriptional repressor LexA [Peptoniphilus grossensis]
MKFTNRLRQALEFRNMSQSELSRLSGIGKSAISQYLSGEYEAKQENIYLMSKPLNVNPAWLMGFDVPMVGGEINRGIPIIGTIAAGTPILAEENIEDYFVIDNRVNADFGLKVKGDSMINANIYNGDIAFIKKQPTLENGEIGAILLDNEATLKRFSKTDNSVVLQAENPSMTDWPRVYTNGNIRVLGKLVGVYSKKD